MINGADICQPDSRFGDHDTDSGGVCYISVFANTTINRVVEAESIFHLEGI